MELLVLILKKTDVLGELLRELAAIGVTGATVVEGTGMARALANDDDFPMFGVLRRVFADAEREPSKVVMMVLTSEVMAQAKKVVHKVVGDFNEPNSGIMFALPVSFVEGIGD